MYVPLISLVFFKGRYLYGANELKYTSKAPMNNKAKSLLEQAKLLKFIPYHFDKYLTIPQKGSPSTFKR